MQVLLQIGLGQGFFGFLGGGAELATALTLYRRLLAAFFFGAPFLAAFFFGAPFLAAFFLSVTALRFCAIRRPWS